MNRTRAHIPSARAREMRVKHVATNEELRPSNRPAHAGHRWLLPFLGFAAIAAAMCLVTVGRHADHDAHTPARFLNEALGSDRSAPLAPVRAGSATARIDAGRLLVQGPQREQVGLSALVGGSPRWERRANGEWRATPFGSEAITLGTADPEHFLTVDRRVGTRTWKWALDTKLTARLLPNGGVGFVDPTSHRISDLTIAPVAIFNSTGDDVTPAGVRWELGPSGTLELNLNDASLPEPYVIDPAFRANGAVATSTAANTVAPAIPAGVLWGDQLLAQISVLAPTATMNVVPPAGWTLIRNERNSTNVALWTFRKRATAAESSPYTFTFQDPTGTNVNKTSRAWVAAYSGIQSSAPIDGSVGNNGGSNRTANVPGVTTTGTNRISVWVIGNSGTATTTQPSINGVATTERRDSTTAAPGLETADATEPTAFTNATVGTGNVLSANAFWAAQVYSLIPDTTLPTQVLSVTEGTNPGGQFFDATTKTHYYNTAALGNFTVGSVPNDADSGFPSVVFNAVAVAGFTHTLVTDTTSPYSSGTYAWTAANTISPGGNRVTITDRNANVLNELTITRDIAGPTAFTLNAPAAAAAIRNGATVSVAAASPTDAGAGVTDVAFRACPGSNGCAWGDGDAFAIGTDTTDQYSVTWPAGQSDGAYQIIARATDNVGNTTNTAAPVNVTLDNTNPSQTLALNAVSQNGGLDQAFKSGNTVYYQGATAGSFRVQSTVSDALSGPASATFAALAGTSTGWSFTGSTISTPAGGPYVSNLYSWAAATTSSPTADATPADVATNSPAATTLTFTNDSTAPASAYTSPAAGGNYNAAAWSGSITGTAADGGSGLATVRVALREGSGNYYDGSTFANPGITWLTPAGTASWSYPIAAAKLTSGSVYTISVRAADNVGNVESPITRSFTYDTAAPTFGTLAIGSPTNASVTGTTVYYRSGVAGSFTLSQPLSDTGGSGPASVQFPAIATTGWTHANETVSGASPYASSSFNWSASPSTPGGYILTGADAAGNTATQGVSFVDDSTAPTAGALTVNGTGATGGGTTSTSNGSFTISRTDYTDADSGIATSTLTRDSAPFTNDGCGTYSGSATTIVGAPAQSLGTGCYEYVLSGTDAVGNTTSIRTVVQVHGTATQIVLTGSTADLNSGTTRVLTATIRDAAGNTVSSDTSTVVAFTKSSGAGTVTGTGNATASNGVATKTITGAVVGAVTMEATSSGLTTGALGAFTVVHGAPAQIALSGSTADLTSSATRALTATIKDAAGNTVTSDNSTVVTFAQAAGAGTVGGTGNATASSGIASKTITAVVAGPVTMEATATGLTTGTLGAFTVVHDTATQIVLSGATTDLASGDTRVLTATIKDAAGNTVTSDNATVVAFTQASGAGTVTGAGNATAAGGVATKTITAVLTGPVTMEATAPGLTDGTLGAFTVVPGTAIEIQLAESGSTMSSDNHTLTATIRDAAGNTVTGDNSTVVTFAKTGGPGTVTGLGNATASSGIATKVVVNAASGQIDLDAQAAGLTTGTASYTIGVGNASTLTSTISASPGSIVANGSSTSAITVQLKDAAGNDLAGSGGTVALGLTGAGSLSAVTDNADGTYSATLTSPTTVGSTTVTGTLNAAAMADTAAVTYTHGPGTQIALTESGSNVAGNAHTLTATIRDAHGNTVTSDSSTVVTFAKSGGAGTVTGLGTATASSGVATTNVSNRLAGQIDLDAQAGGLTTGTTSYTITLGPVSPAASDSTVIAAPTVVYASGSDSATITVTLRDAGGNPIAGKTVTLDQGAGNSTVSGGGSTNASGVVTFSATNLSVESVTYGATDTTDSITLTDDASVDFTFFDGTAPTNTITLGSVTRAWLTGTSLYYNGAAGGSFTLSSAVADGGSGPASATYPAVTQPGWTHNGETVSTPAGGPYVSSTFSFNAGSSGNFTHVVTAADAWTPANTSQTTLNVTEDSTAPAASILCNAAACSAGWYLSSPVSVTLAAPDAGAGLDQIRYTTDGTDPTIFTGAVYSGAFDVAAEGVTTVKYRAFDRIGNDTGVQAQAVRIDTIAPDTTIDSTPAAATQDTTPTFAFSSEIGATLQARVNGGSWTSETSPLTLGPLAENTYTFEVRATDVAGNVDASPASFTFTVDTTAANTTITSSPPAPSSSTSASFSFTASDAGPGFECRLDGAAFTDCSSPQSYTGLSEAPHTFEVRAEDAAGNVDATPDTHAWTVDQTAPDTSFSSTPTDPSANTTPTFGLGSTETPSTFECKLDGGGWSSCSTPVTTPSLGDGSHTLKARATDAAGNTDASEVTITWLVDATAPTGSVTSPANGADVGTTIALTSDSADTGGSGVATVVFQRSPAGVGTWTSQAASWDTTAQADGDYDLRVVTTDNAGNAFTSGAITVTVDNTEPSLSVLAPNPVNLATPDPATVSATATDDGTGVANVRFDQCIEDSPACLTDSWVLLGVDTGAPYSASWPIPSDGERLLRVRATDNAGRQKTELVLVTVDRIRPSGSVTAPAAGANLRGAAVALAATASDTAPGTVNTVTFQRSPAGAGTWTDVATDSAAPYTAGFDTTAVADGLYDLRVFTTDAAGNAEAAPATLQVRVDNTLPTGAVTAPAAGADVRGTVGLTSDSADPLVNSSASGVATVVFQRSPAGAGSWTNQAASFDTTAVTDGQYDLRVTTTDLAGNSFTSTPVTIRVDNTLPTGAVTGPAAGANVRGTVGLTSDSADPLVNSSASGVATVQFQRSPAGAGSWTNQAASFDTTSVSDGQYDLRVTTTDLAGNSFTSSPITIRVDNTLPTGSITAPANGAEIGVPPVTLTSNSADAGGSGVGSVVFERSPAGAGTWTATGSSWNTASGPDAVADGSYDLRVKTTDNAGNVFTSALITVLVDHTAPTTTASLAPGTPSNAPVTVSFSANDGAGSGVSVISHRVDGGSLQLGAAVVVPAPGDHSNDGSHLVEFFATDEVGNIEAPKNITVVIDTTAPSGSGGDPGDYLRGIATLTYSTGAGDVSSVQFQFSPAGAGAWSNVGAADIAPPYEASWNTTLVADGPYDLRAVVTDTTGNVANTLLPGLPKTVDNAAPTGSVTAPAAGAYVSGAIAIDALATDGAVPPASGVSAVRFEVKPAGAGAYSVFGTQTAPVLGSTYRQTLTTTALADGSAELRVVVTDVAGNETTSAPRAINIDNDAPLVTLDDPGTAVGSSINLTATSSADTSDVTFRYRPVGTLGAGTAIGSDATAPFGVTWSTPPAAEQQWELIAVATDGGGNVTTSAPRVVRVDRTQPTGSVTAPATAATIGGPAVVLAANAADPGGSGVTLVEWLVKEFGSGSFNVVASDATAPYSSTWNSTGAPDGATEIRAVVTDGAGNTRTTSVIPVTVDSTGPSVNLTDPGAVLSGTISLEVTTGGGAARVQLAVSPADAGTWTQIEEDTTAPYGASFDTAALADGLYDLRAIGYDSLGNASTPSLREDVRLDNTAPALVSSTPADGSVSVSANEIVLVASEPVSAPGALLDGAPAPAPTIAGNQLAFPTGALADGLHVLEGELQDASGARVRFRVAVTIESSPSADPPPVERSVTASGDWTLTVPGGLVTVRMPQSAWPTPPTPQDYILVLRVDARPGGGSFSPGTQIVDVTARWALAGTAVTEFKAPIEIIFSNPSGTPTVPGHSPDASTWRTIPPISGPLGASQRDGFTRSGSDVHVWTRHLTYFGLMLDDSAPTEPRDLAGVVADDGLTLRWIPGTDSSGQLGNVVLYVNGEPYREFGPTEFEAKLGAFVAGDSRSFTLAQKDAAGNVSRQTAPLRAVPPLAGKTLEEAAAALGAAGFTVGDVRRTTAALVPPGTVVEPATTQFALASSRIDLVVARDATAPQTRLAFSVAASKRIELKQKTTIAVRIKVSKPAQVTIVLRDTKQRPLHTWTVPAKAGANVVKLRLPAKVRRAGTYSLTWVARSGAETVSRTIKLTLVGPALAQVKPTRDRIEIVLAGATPPGEALHPGQEGMPRRVTSAAGADQTFELVASAAHEVSVVVVDADVHGTRFVADLRTVFPKVRVIAISREPARRLLAVRAGAALALPRNTSARQLAKAIALVAGS